MRSGRSCDRVRQWISLDADGALSEFERALLAGHLAGCGECREFVAHVAALHQALSEAPLERLSRPIELQSSRSRASLLSRVYLLAPAAAAVITFAIGLGAWQTSGSQER